MASFSIGCQRFEEPKVSLQADYTKGEDVIHFYATINDGGGDEIFTKKGYSFSMHNHPSALDRDSESVLLYHPRKQWYFDWNIYISQSNFVKDSSYYYVAWAQTNAGTGYSNIIEVKVDSIGTGISIIKH
jgi:hypothetical protein